MYPSECMNSNAADMFFMIFNRVGQLPNNRKPLLACQTHLVTPSFVAQILLKWTFRIDYNISLGFGGLS